MCCSASQLKSMPCRETRDSSCKDKLQQFWNHLRLCGSLSIIHLLISTKKFTIKLHLFIPNHLRNITKEPSIDFVSNDFELVQNTIADRNKG